MRSVVGHAIGGARTLRDLSAGEVRSLKRAMGLGGQELLPGRARAAGVGGDTGVMQDLPDRASSDRVAAVVNLGHLRLDVTADVTA